MTKRKPLTKTRAESVNEFVKELKKRTSAHEIADIDALAADFVAGDVMRAGYDHPVKAEPVPAVLLDAALEDFPDEDDCVVEESTPWWKSLLGIA